MAVDGLRVYQSSIAKFSWFMNKHAIRILLDLMNAPQQPHGHNECDAMSSNEAAHKKNAFGTEKSCNANK